MRYVALYVCHIRSPHHLHPGWSGCRSEPYVLHWGSLQSGCKCSFIVIKKYSIGIIWLKIECSFSVNCVFKLLDPFCQCFATLELDSFSTSSQDYGMWERGDKTNQGITEINASSIGMAKVTTHMLTNTANIIFQQFPSSFPLLGRISGKENCGKQVDEGEDNFCWVLSEDRDRTGAVVKKSLAGRKVSSLCCGLYADL